jgi:superfamily II DNA or RNA helicase
MKLRAYQDQAVDALLKDAYAGLCPIGVLPTGAGKTVVMRAIIEQWLQDHPEHQILLLAHRTRLLTQARERFEGIPTLVVSAGMGMRDEAVPGSVTVASIQTISGLENRRDWDLVLVDEAHRVGTEEEGGLAPCKGQYAAFLQSLNKDPPIIGLTATPWRMVDNRHVPIYGPQSLFQKASCWIYPEDLIAQGYLLAPEVVPVRYILPTTGIQLSHGEVAVAGIDGYRPLDFTQRIQEILEKTEGCSHVLIFCDTIKEAEAVAEALAGCQPLAGRQPLAGCEPLDSACSQQGLQPAGSGSVASCVLHGGHTENERNAQIERFRMGTFRYLVNVDVFTEGLDVPEIDAVVLLRRTQSVVRYLQMAGRGLRPFAVRQDHEQGKTTCRILDYGQHIERLGPVEAARGENAMPLAWKKRRWKNRDTEMQPLRGATLLIHEPDKTQGAPACIEPEAAFCVPLKALRAFPIRARNSTDFLLLRFRIDDPFAGCNPDPSSNKTLWVERKLHASDPSLQEMARRWSRLSGVSVKKLYGTKDKETSLPMQMMSMLGSGQGFLDYAPFAVRVRWSERAERWMVDGWQWSGRAHMHMEVGDERALNAWIQRTAGTQDAVEQTMRQFLYRLSRSGVLDLQDAMLAAALQTASLPEPVGRASGSPEKMLEEQESATVGGVYNNNAPHERDSPPAGWGTPPSPPSFLQAHLDLPVVSPSPMVSPSVGSAVFPPSRPPAWLSQEIASGGLAADRLASCEVVDEKRSVAIPAGVQPRDGAQSSPSGGNLPTAATLEDFKNAGGEGSLWFPQGVS